MRGLLNNLLILILLLLSACSGEQGFSPQNAIFQIELISPPDVLAANRTYNFLAKITNISGRDIPASVLSGMKLGYHWSPEENHEIYREGIRSPLPPAFFASSSSIVNFKVTAPESPGNYSLLPGIVEENKSWLDSTTSAREFSVSSWEKYDQERTLLFETGLKNLDRASRLAISVIRSNTWTIGNIFCFSAGAIYPDAWLRDFYWSLPALKWLASDQQLLSIIEDNISHQKQDGQLPDWANKTKWLKNDVLTDQEMVAALSTCLIHQFSPDIEHFHLIPKLEKAMTWLWDNRLDQQTGMITSGHIADWGDVEFEDSGDEGLLLGETSHLVAGIYLQALAVQSAESLAYLLDSSGDHEKATFWQQQAQTLREKAQALWNKEKGYFLIHRHLSELVHDFDESSVFALAGNTQAIKAGIATPEQTRQIMNRQPDGSFAACLSPSFPEGFFKHSYMLHQDEYQNGGIWIWHASQFIKEEFDRGYSEKALVHLADLADLALKNKDFHEWHDHAGTGKGSHCYAASATSFLDALISGYYGIKLQGDNLTISPRLGRNQGRIRLQLPGQNRNLVYRYSYSPNKVEIKTKGTLTRRFSLFWLIPKDFSPSTVNVNSDKLEFKIISLAEDHYLVVKELPLGSRIVISSS